MPSASRHAFLHLLASFVCCNRAQQSFPSTPAELYREGVQHYHDNDFSGCVHQLEAAVSRFKAIAHKLHHCRQYCHEESVSGSSFCEENVENLRFLEKTITNAICLEKCKRRDLPEFDGHQPDADTQTVFDQRKPYQYLHVCYARNKQLQKAANAAFTYLVQHPNDNDLWRSFKNYIKEGEIDRENVVNYEAYEFVSFYAQGVQAYTAKQWLEVVSTMEASLKLFLRAEEECRLQCEDTSHRGWDDEMREFIPAISKHCMHVLLCKRQCNPHMSTLNGEKHDDLLASHYHYLQFAYFKADHLKDACQAASSYLLWYPEDKIMRQNVEFYKSLPQSEDDYFQVREDASQYVRRKIYEERVYRYLMDLEEGKNLGKFKFNIPHLPRKRFVQDNMLTENQCEGLVKMAKNYSIAGDGYKSGNSSPHTIHEDYSGLSLKRVISLLQVQKLNGSNISSLLNITNDVKAIVQRQFNVERKLYFSYTQLVCRSAKTSDSTFIRTDLSHSIHADNCNIEEDGKCPKTWPAFTWRDYTAIVYLNSDFVGGELFFSKDLHGSRIEETVRPQCGRLVGFTSGEENLHGVKAIRQGSRCALAIWFTYDRTHKEHDREHVVECVDE